LSPGGVKVRLGDIAKINKAAGPNKIIRENQKRKVAILANISQKKDLGHIMAEVKKRISAQRMR
jgi:Cu/Ag efflux pump CusA